MDVTPQLIEQIDFSEKFRGYDPDQVDDFLERVGATIAELSKSSREATERADRAEAELRSGGGAAPVGRGPVAALSDEEEAMQSTRTLMMAKRTADVAIADARQEAQKLVADTRTTTESQLREAQTEADRIVGEARVTADQMTQKASAEASREYGVRRDQILAEIGDLENRKVAMTGQMAAIETRLEDYRSALGRIHSSIGDLLEDPEAMLRDPIEGLDLPPLAPPVAPTPVIEPERAPADEPEPVAKRAAEPEPAAARSEAIDEPDLGSAFEPVAFADDDGGAFDGLGAFDGPVNGSTPETLGDATLLDADDLASPFGDQSPTGATDLLASADLAWNDPPADDAVPADPWGPGSWGEVAASADSPFGFDERPDGGLDADATTASHTFGEFPSDGLPLIGQDRYTRDLDQAVNQPDDPAADDAMAAFFEGDDDPQTRRFGRRR